MTEITKIIQQSHLEFAQTLIGADYYAVEENYELYNQITLILVKAIKIRFLRFRITTQNGTSTPKIVTKL